MYLYDDSLIFLIYYLYFPMHIVGKYFSVIKIAT